MSIFENRPGLGSGEERLHTIGSCKRFLADRSTESKSTLLGRAAGVRSTWQEISIAKLPSSVICLLHASPTVQRRIEIGPS